MTARRTAHRTGWLLAVICTLTLAGLPADALTTAVSPDGTASNAGSLVRESIFDPASGRTVAVWSQFDGISRKIAYARIENGAWSDFHYLTFGHGNHTGPRIGISRDGAFLFWIADGRQYMYAPIDLSAGRLHAPPHRLPLKSAGLTLLNRPPSGGIGKEGGTDVPIIVDDCPFGEDDCAPVEPTPDPNHRFLILPEGGTDVPVVVDAEVFWTATTSVNCSRIVLTIPDPQRSSIHLVAFEGHEINRTGTIRVTLDTLETQSVGAVTAVLDASCF